MTLLPLAGKSFDVVLCKIFLLLFYFFLISFFNLFYPFSYYFQTTHHVDYLYFPFLLNPAALFIVVLPLELQYF